MKLSKIIDSSKFMLCLGMNNGTITIGGYNEDLLYYPDSTIQWLPLIEDKGYSIELKDLYIGNVHIPHVPRIGFIDSGSSWVYMNYEEEKHVLEAFEQFCKNEGKCIGKKLKLNCYEYDITMNKSIRDFFRSYPTITFSTPSGTLLNWYPSEYFSQQGERPEYCISIEGIRSKNQIVLGSSFLRQNLIVFDPEESPKVGFARGKCSDEKDRVTTEVVNVSSDFYQVECHTCDYIQEETNIILL
mmetsp:Transcript_30881/g.27312  ORF Transcript_30881/g.27312 Transcript_30881/m.27312 type:complete len:243 (-) Transcript_30881:192-920(-)